MEPLNVSRRNSVSIHSLECIIYPKKCLKGTVLIQTCFNRGSIEIKPTVPFSKFKYCMMKPS